MALFSKRHYEWLAKQARTELRIADESNSLSQIITTRTVYYHLMNDLSQDNPAFDRDRFLKASGLEAAENRIVEANLP